MNVVSPIPVGAFHASRQKLARMLDFQEVAHNEAQIDAALSQATAANEAYLHRGFFPFIGTRSFDWPDVDTSQTSYRIWLDDNELISVSSISSGGVSIPPANLMSYPTVGPPYTRVETSFSTNSVFQAGNTWQNAVTITGTWCGTALTTVAAGTLVSTINSSATALTISAGGIAGVGDVLLVDSEYMVCTGLTAVTSGQTLQTPMTASAANTSVVVTTGSSFSTGEAITLDSEQMLVTAIVGNSLLVKRAWNGTPLATHTGSTIFYPRSLSVNRGQCGSTAASHTLGVNVGIHYIPSAVQSLTLAEAAWLYMNHAQGWQIAPGTTSRATTQVAALNMIVDLREKTMRAAGRKGRQRTV